MPFFSIIIPCYNATKTLGDTLDSIAAQTDTDWEALIRARQPHQGLPQPRPRPERGAQ